MVKRTLIDKCTTIIEDSTDNYGLNPTGMLYYGTVRSRCLLHFDMTGILDLYEDGVFTEGQNVRHILRLTNCASFGKSPVYINSKGLDRLAERTSSFDVILFEVKQKWDEGVGFDSSCDKWYVGENAASKNGCNWLSSRSGERWHKDGIIDWNDPEGLNIVGTQHFDHGNENFEFDITDYVLGFFRKAKEYSELFTSLPEDERRGKMRVYLEHYNFGLGLAFSEDLDTMRTEVPQYVGFFTNNTNTIFHPYVESRRMDAVSDDRYTFYLNKRNRLYLYVNVDNELVNLDTLPTCTIDGTSYEVRQQGKGIYYTEIVLSSKDYEPDMILSDVWGNIVIDGEAHDDVEMEFVTLRPSIYFNLGEKPDDGGTLSMDLYGINDSERLNQGEDRMVRALFKRAFTHNDFELVKNGEYRVYVKDGSDEIDIIRWDRIERANRFNYFHIDTTGLMPADYHVDVRIEYGNESRIYKDKLQFSVVNNKTFLKK